jgi:hypothetical protein
MMSTLSRTLNNLEIAYNNSHRAAWDTLNGLQEVDGDCLLRDESTNANEFAAEVMVTGR